MNSATVLEQSKKMGLSKLVLQTAHLCNLRCVYCISDAGRWGKNEENYMDPKLAAYAVQTFAELYGKIELIYFFGGEPSLNLEAIRYVALKCKELVKLGKLISMPRLFFSSNGTVATNEFVQVVNDFDVNFSVSIDGPPEIHDKLRKGIDGSPNFHKIVDNIRHLRKLTNKPDIIEMTFTRDHLESGWKLWDMMKFLYNETGVKLFSAYPVINAGYQGNTIDIDPIKSKERTIEQFIEAARGTIHELLTSSNPICFLQAIKIFKLFQSVGTLEYCPAGRNYFSVASNGDIYPCQNIPETREQLISNIKSSTLWDDICNSSVVKQIIDANANAGEILADKWYGRFCRICPAENISETGTLVDYSPFRHEIQAKIANEVVNRLVDISKDDAQYCKLTSQLKKIYSVSTDD